MRKMNRSLSKKRVILQQEKKGKKVQKIQLMIQKSNFRRGSQKRNGIEIEIGREIEIGIIRKRRETETRKIGIGREIATERGIARTKKTRNIIIVTVKDLVSLKRMQNPSKRMTERENTNTL